MEQVYKTIDDLSEFIQQIIENGSSEELQLLPELVNALSNLISVSSLDTDLHFREQLREESKNLLPHQ
ncbi:hypothetical protein [Oceanobacillus sp. FSL W7-1281]|uniref:hypothetical protein n=1 Tax=Oceanobacillus sp. FSL W7-1281 TaxID=2921698 RepID=UPI0030DAEDCC